MRTFLDVYRAPRSAIGNSRRMSTTSIVIRVGISSKTMAVYHCAAILSTADAQEDLEDAPWEYGLIVKLGVVGGETERKELWAIQEGMRPGSNYTLLLRAPGTDGLIAKFTVLQQKCPASSLREVEGFSMDVWSTAYCAINSRDELLALATAMAAEKPVGTIALVPNEKGPGAAPDPSK